MCSLIEVFGLFEPRTQAPNKMSGFLFVYLFMYLFISWMRGGREVGAEKYHPSFFIS
jgi:hypothetical protein